mgnify:CR=1 FL=1
MTTFADLVGRGRRQRRPELTKAEQLSLFGEPEKVEAKPKKPAAKVKAAKERLAGAVGRGDKPPSGYRPAPKSRKGGWTDGHGSYWYPGKGVQRAGEHEGEHGDDSAVAHASERADHHRAQADHHKEASKDEHRSAESRKKHADAHRSHREAGMSMDSLSRHRAYAGMARGNQMAAREESPWVKEAAGKASEKATEAGDAADDHDKDEWDKTAARHESKRAQHERAAEALLVPPTLLGAATPRTLAPVGTSKLARLHRHAADMHEEAIRHNRGSVDPKAMAEMSGHADRASDEAHAAGEAHKAKAAKAETETVAETLARQLPAETISAAIPEAGKGMITLYWLVSDLMIQTKAPASAKAAIHEHVKAQVDKLKEAGSVDAYHEGRPEEAIFRKVEGPLPFQSLAEQRATDRSVGDARRATPTSPDDDATPGFSGGLGAGYSEKDLMEHAAKDGVTAAELKFTFGSHSNKHAGILRKLVNEGKLERRLAVDPRGGHLRGPRYYPTDPKPDPNEAASAAMKAGSAPDELRQAAREPGPEEPAAGSHAALVAAGKEALARADHPKHVASESVVNRKTSGGRVRSRESGVKEAAESWYKHQGHGGKPARHEVIEQIQKDVLRERTAGDAGGASRTADLAPSYLHEYARHVASQYGDSPQPHPDPREHGLDTSDAGDLTRRFHKLMGSPEEPTGWSGEHGDAQMPADHGHGEEFHQLLQREARANAGVAHSSIQNAAHLHRIVKQADQHVADFAENKGTHRSGGSVATYHPDESQHWGTALSALKNAHGDTHTFEAKPMARGNQMAIRAHRKSGKSAPKA